MRTGRLGRTLHVRIVFSPSVFSTQRDPNILRNAAELRGPGPFCGLPSWQIATISVLLWGACFSRRSAEPAASALGGLNTLAIFLLGLCSACLLLVDFIHCGIFPRPTKYGMEGLRGYMQQQSKISLRVQLFFLISPRVHRLAASR